MIFLLHTLIVLGSIYVGVRLKGIGLGLMGALGTLVLIFIFGMQPGSPPVDVMLIIISVVLAASAMEAAGGIKLLLKIAEKIMRSNPRFITFLGPMTTYIFTLFAGTSHIIYGLLPIISEISVHHKTRPERPLTMSVIASHLAITASPVSAATAAMATIISPSGFGLKEIFLICIPSTFLGSLMGILFVWNKGKSWDKDPLLQKISLKQTHEEQVQINMDPTARKSVLIFASAVLGVSFFGLFPHFLPEFTDANGAVISIKTPVLIELIMLGAAGIILLLCKKKPGDISHSPVFKTGMEAMISIFGVVWLTDTFLMHNMPHIKSLLSDWVQAYPFMFVGALFIFSAIIFSQAGTTKALMPLGIALGIPAPLLIAMFPAVNGDFVIPGYPTLVAAANFDRTGSTRFGKYMFNHSFMLPGLVSIGATVLIGFLLSKLI